MADDEAAQPEEGAAAAEEPATEEPAAEEPEGEKKESVPTEPAEGAQEGGEPGEGTDKPKDGDKPKPKKDSLKQLFDSKGSLLETQSFVKEKLEEFKQKRAAVAALIGELQGKVKAYKEKENPTDEDIANLKKYHAQFLEKLGEYEEMTRNLEKLMGMADVPTSQLDLNMSGPTMTKPEKDKTKAAEPAKPPRPSQEATVAIEEKLPKLIVCGTDIGDNVPRIIVCEPLRKKDLEPFGGGGTAADVKPGDCMNKLNECFMTQQKLAAENAEVQKIRHQQQQKLLDMQDQMDHMKQNMMVLEMANRRVMTENQQLQERLRSQPQGPPSPGGYGGGGIKQCRRELYMQYRGQPAEASDQPPPSLQNLVCRCKRRQ